MPRYYRRRNASQDAPGQDSFLDIVANLVGILIILLVVVGSQASVLVHRSPDENADSQLQELHQKLQHTAELAGAFEQDNQDVEHRIRIEQAVAEARRLERRQLLDQLLALQRQIDASERRSQVASLTQLAQQRDELIRQIAVAADNNRQLLVAHSEPNVIEHVPTPIAKTVFTDEIHFRLSAGRVVHVPLNELIDAMRSQWRVIAENLKGSEATAETVGPIGDFRLQYELRRETLVRHTSAGSTQEEWARFNRFILVPVAEPLGEPVERALAADSQFSRFLERSAPGRTTVSLWVYPDSYSEYNQLRAWLRKRGYQTAAWPLAEGAPISGSPHGHRSSAQ